MNKICSKCNEELEITKNFSYNKLKLKYMTWCYDCVRKYNNEKTKKLKIKVLTHYGNNELKCVKCECNEPMALSIDHINGEGLTHLRLIKCSGGSSLYSWLIKNNYPKEFQTLCFNCQFIKEAELRAEKISKHPAGLKYKNKLKKTIIHHYSDGKYSCKFCEFSDIRALSIDHTNGGGIQHRKHILKKNKRLSGGGGHNFYNWLKKENYPDGYQILCMNCQQIKKILYETKRNPTPKRCEVKFNILISNKEKAINSKNARLVALQATKNFYLLMSPIIFELKLKGLKEKEIAIELNKFGYKTRNGLEWKFYTVIYFIKCSKKYIS